MKNNKIGKWDKESIKELLLTNDTAVKRAIGVLYSFQTEDEKEVDLTIHPNKKGFDAWDARELSKLAKKMHSTDGVSQEEINCVRPRLLKYANQLARVANENEAIKAEEQMVLSLAIETFDKEGNDEPDNSL